MTPKKYKSGGTYFQIKNFATAEVNSIEIK